MKCAGLLEPERTSVAHPQSVKGIEAENSGDRRKYTLGFSRWLNREMIVHKRQLKIYHWIRELDDTFKR